MKITTALAMLFILTSLATAQPLQTGTKTAPAMVVACAAKTSTLEAMKSDVDLALPALWADCQAAGLHPVGLPTLSVDLSTVGEGPLNWELWLPLADAFDPARLPQKPGLTIKQVPATPVAYTYHAGNPWLMGETFERLYHWATNKGLDIGTHARATIYVWLAQPSDANTMTECQIELRQ
ncbi:MAG: hypothetical protein ACYC63_09345 [Armatimonadota bacterium]